MEWAGRNMNGATFYNRNGTPSTPQTSNVGIATGQSQAHTPHLTPGRGRFGQFQYARACIFVPIEDERGRLEFDGI